MPKNERWPFSSTWTSTSSASAPRISSAFLIASSTVAPSASAYSSSTSSSSRAEGRRTGRLPLRDGEEDRGPCGREERVREGGIAPSQRKILLGGFGLQRPLAVRHEVLLGGGQEIGDGPVEDQPRRQIVKQHEQENVHELHGLHLARIGRCHALLQDGRAEHDEGQQTDGETQEGKQHVGGGEIVDPGHEGRLAQLDRVQEDLIEREQDRHLDQQRKAAPEGVALVLLVKREHRRIH